VDLESRKIDLVLAQPKADEAVPAPLERARAAALDALGPKPPRRRKAKGGAEGAAVPVSRQEARVTPAEPAASTFGATDESEEDVVFVPPPRGRRGTRSAAPAASKTAAKKTAAKKSDSTRSASKTRKKK